MIDEDAMRRLEAAHDNLSEDDLMTVYPWHGQIEQGACPQKIEKRKTVSKAETKRKKARRRNARKQRKVRK
jgi:hypothetical protein